MANKFVMKTLDELVVEKVESFETDLLKAVKPVIAAKQYGVEDTIAKLVVDAVALVMKNGSFNVDNISGQGHGRIALPIASGQGYGLPKRT